MKKILILILGAVGALMALTMPIVYGQEMTSWEFVELPEVPKSSDGNPQLTFYFDELQYYYNDAWHNYYNHAYLTGQAYLWFDVYDDDYSGKQRVSVNVYMGDFMDDIDTIKDVSIDEYQTFAIRVRKKITSPGGGNNDGEVKEITRFDELPYTLENVDIDVDIIKSGSYYQMTFDFKGGIKYRLTVSELPHHKDEGFKDEARLPNFMKYYTKNGQREIFYWWQNDPSSGDIMLDLENKNIDGFRPFVTYNIDTGKLHGVKKLLIYGKTFLKNDFGYADLLFPFDLDDLLQIRVQYTTVSTQAYVHTSTKNWDLVRINGSTTQFGNYWDFWWRGITGDHASTLQYLKQFVFGKNDIEQIKRVDSEYSSSSAKKDYVKKINDRLIELGEKTVTENQLFKNENSMWRIALQKHHDPFQTKVSITEVNVAEVLYVYKGEYFFVGQDDISSIIKDAETGTDLDDIMNKFNDFIAWFKNNKGTLVIIFYVLIGLTIFGIISPFIPIVGFLLKGGLGVIFFVIRAIFNILFGWMFPKKNRNKFL